MSKYSTNDQYIDSSSGILINKLGITDESTLEKMEADYATARSVELAKTPLELPFTINTIKIIHKKLFSDLYEWAGEFRNLDISKGKTRFASFNNIKSCISELFSNLQEENFLVDDERQL